VYVGVSGLYHDILKAEKSDEYEPAAVIGESVTKQIFIRVGSLLQKSR